MSVPAIFSPPRRAQIRARAAARRGNGGTAFLVDEAADDIAERLAFLRHQPARALVSGDTSGTLTRALAAAGADVTDGSARDDEAPYPDGGYGLVVNLFRLDAANDLPGALIHLGRALAPGGLAFAQLLGAGSLPVLRALMLAADGDRPAPRLHPQVDVRGAGPLLQRAGWADPVIDTRTVTASYAAPERLVADLRDHGLSSSLARSGPPLGKAAWARAKNAFAKLADADGRATERFEILTLSGWRPSTSSG